MKRTIVQVESLLGSFPLFASRVEKTGKKFGPEVIRWVHFKFKFIKTKCLGCLDKKSRS